MAWQRELEQQAFEESDRAEMIREVLLRAERETKRQLAFVDALRVATENTNPTKMHMLAEHLLIHDIDWSAAGWINIAEVIELLRTDQEFQRIRRQI